MKNVQGMYRTPLMEVSTKCVLTNTTQVTAYRGAGRPEGNYYMERLIDAAAAEMGIDRVAVRRRNQIWPQELPRQVASSSSYDSGDFIALTKHALELADSKGFARRKRESRKRGKLRGLGVTKYRSDGAAGEGAGRHHFDADGTVTLTTGTLDFGMGHATPFAQVLSDQLGVPVGKVKLVQGDSDEIPVGGGSGGSKSLMHSGTAIVQGAAKVVENGKQLAAYVLEAAPADIAFERGALSLSEPIAPFPLQSSRKNCTAVSSRPPTFRNRSTWCTSATDRARPPIRTVATSPKSKSIHSTGFVELVKYSCVNDFGTLVNPMIVEGQLHGGVVQGIGEAYMEQTVYDEEGQLLTGSFMDYAMPRAADVPSFAVADHGVPTKTNPLGVKGVGEAGCAVVCPAR